MHRVNSKQSKRYFVTSSKIEKVYQVAISRKPIETIDLRRLSNLNPYKSLLVLFVEWLLIISAIVLHLYFSNPAIYLIAWIIIGTRMYALYSLLHDGLHYLLFPNRKVNDIICKVFLAWPLFISFATMRNNHLAHHKFLKTPADPEAVHLNYSEFKFPQPKRELALTFFKDICGINFIFYKAKKIRSFIGGQKQLSTNGIPAGRHENQIYPVIYYSVILFSVFYLGWVNDFILYWLVPYITLYQVLNRVRLSAEHFNLGSEDKFLTRTMKLSKLESFLMSPHNLGYHTEHHLYPSVPFYHLTELHQKLMVDDEYRRNISIQTSYINLLKKYITA